MIKLLHIFFEKLTRLSAQIFTDQMPFLATDLILVKQLKIFLKLSFVNFSAVNLSATGGESYETFFFYWWKFLKDLGKISASIQ